MAQVHKSHCGDHGRYLSQPENGSCYTLAIIFSIIKDKDEIPAGIVETSGTAAQRHMPEIGCPDGAKLIFIWKNEKKIPEKTNKKEAYASFKYPKQRRCSRID